jgi:ribosomal protein S18 acetylase RimI-like enzyme
MDAIITITSALLPDDIQVARSLFLEYGKSLNFDLCFQSFDEELAALPGQYAPPDGRLFIARYDGKAAGCIALRKLDNSICEMKRLYVKPEFRGKKIGELLVRRILREASGQGYRTMRLDTVPSMITAQTLYRSLGFVEITSYCANPVEGAVFMERDLTKVPA